MRSHRRGALGAALALSVGAGACSSKTLPPPGELMVVVSTDASPPKDIDTLHVTVKVGGQTRLDSDYTLGPSSGGLLVPATLGLVAGPEPSMPVGITVYARKGGSAGKVRVLREATVTVPTDRLAMLRMPINWLCYDDVADVLGDGGLPTGEFMNAKCGPGQTCAAGNCIDDAAPDPATLPDFVPGQVFGGGTGDGDGTCFDTLACFASPVLATVDPATCTIEKPAGGAQVNVAMQVGPSGSGACEPAGAPCFIALDAESSEGWQTKADDASRIQLPQEVCVRLANGKLVGVVTSTACPPKQVENPPCGVGSSVGGGVGDAASE